MVAADNRKPPVKPFLSLYIHLHVDRMLNQIVPTHLNGRQCEVGPKSHERRQTQIDGKIRQDSFAGSRTAGILAMCMWPWLEIKKSLDVRGPPRYSLREAQ